jgi:drug/metabolite transporter (DMT)-like permease
VNKYLGLTVIALCSIIISGVLIRFSQCGPIATGGYRLLLSLPLLIILDMLNRNTQNVNLNLGTSFVAILAGLAFALDLAFFNWSIIYTSLAEANLLTNMVVFIITPISIFIFKEKLNPKFYYTIVIALIGLVCLLNQPHINLTHIRGDWLALISTIFYAFFLALVKYARKNYTATKIMWIVSISGSILLFFIAYFRGERLVPLNISGWGILASVAFCGQVSGQTLLAYAIKYIPLKLGSILLLMSPVIAAFFAYVLFHETLGILQIAGIIIILSSIYFAKKYT